MVFSVMIRQRIQMLSYTSILSYDEVLERELKVMDLAAFTLARDHNIPIRVFNMNKPGCLKAVVMGENEGTLIDNQKTNKANTND